jgi:preprotein translocase subunit SecG
MSTTIVTILIVIVCLALIGIVLIQNPKGGGISSSFGALNQIGGVKQTTEGVERVTWILAIALVLFCLFATPLMKGGTAQNSKGSSPESTVPMNNLPADAITMPGSAAKKP